MTNSSAFENTRYLVETLNLKAFPYGTNWKANAQSLAATCDLGTLESINRKHPNCGWRIKCDRNIACLYTPRYSDYTDLTRAVCPLKPTWMVGRTTGTVRRLFRIDEHIELPLNTPLLGTRAVFRGTFPVPGSPDPTTGELYQYRYGPRNMSIAWLADQFVQQFRVDEIAITPRWEFDAAKHVKNVADWSGFSADPLADW